MENNMDFLMIATRVRKGIVEIYPKFIVGTKKITDLMIRGGDFYAVWVEEKKLWSTDEQDAIDLIDSELDKYYEKNASKYDGQVRVLHMWDSESGMIDLWHKYCQKQMRDMFVTLDENVIFSNMDTTKKDYASKKLSYPLEKGDFSSYDLLMSTLYSETERQKIEWAIGSIVNGDSKNIQKFLVLYGAAGTGKSTVLNIIQMLFDGYYSVFDAKALGSSTNSFALEAFKSNPLVAIQHDGDLSKIEDNTRLNSLVSHEIMTVNEKFKSTYSNRFKCFLFMGTNKPVKITDAKSGLIRRLIDVSPTGDKVSPSEYKRIMSRIKFELGAIAYHCKEVYEKNPNLYDDYIPTEMIGASNDFYNYISSYFFQFKEANETTLKAAWEMYKAYCDDARVQYPLSQRAFKEELKNYFDSYSERGQIEDGTRVRSYYYGFKADKFMRTTDEQPETKESGIIFKEQPSYFDKYCQDCKAQYANEGGTPFNKWSSVETTLKDLDTTKLHYVMLPENHVVIDFDIPDEDGNKSLEKNLKEANKWPATYAELSKSGSGIHLHYLYSGDVKKLSRVFDDHIEVKIFSGNSSLRRKLTKCNDVPIKTINSGLPLKEDNVALNYEGIKNEKAIRTIIKRHLNKEYVANTAPSINLIAKTLDEAYSKGLKYDVSDLRNSVILFAAGSTHQAEACLKKVAQMKFKSDEPSEPTQSKKDRIVFFDCEVFPNLFLVNWKFQGKGCSVSRMINPSPKDIEDLLDFKLVGFNNRRYDNHILYGRFIGYNNEQLYELSKRLIRGDRDAFFGEAYNLSYTDIYDFSSEKQSLKKFEIDLGIHHKELGLPWDQPVPEDKWIEVAEYCDNDVIATEAVFEARQFDFVARKILADIAGMTVNDTTNTLTARIIFGADKHPQSQFIYRNLGDPNIEAYRMVVTKDGTIYPDTGDDFTLFDTRNRPIFPGYIYDHGVSIYRGEEVGEGGYVYSEPGIYENVALLDIASMHPSSAIEEEIFGEKYTARFKDLRDSRIEVKHNDIEKLKTMFGGVFAKYIEQGVSFDDLAYALKIAINAVYGLTSATFPNPFKDPRNIDNIVAKRGALFMINLKHAVQAKGYTVCHIKTDSIKIANADKDIVNFVNEYGKMYGYSFEHEATYDRICLVNKSTYIAKYMDPKTCKDIYGYAPKNNVKKALKWTATGKQFQVPYVFKTMFSGEPIIFDDMCETIAVTTALYLDMNESLPEGEHDYRFVGKVGRFCPIKKGCGGGELVRKAKDKNGNDKYDSAVGCKGWRWLESELVKTLGQEDSIDKGYYTKLINEAIEEISKYGDYEWFSSDEQYDAPPWC